MEYVVCHCRKVQTTVGLGNVAAHNCREAVYDSEFRPLGSLEDYISHPERAAMFQGERLSREAVLKRRSDRITAAKLDRKPQKNAAAGIEIVLSASPEWFDAHNPKEWQSYFKDARKFLEAKYGPENLLHWAVHYDEKTPHMHVLFVPITENVQARDSNGKKALVVPDEEVLHYSSSNFLGGRKGLRLLHSDLALAVGKKYGLARGQEGSKARHTDQYEWAAENTQERDNLAMERGGLDLRRADLAKEEKALAKERAKLEEDKRALGKAYEEGMGETLRGQFQRWGLAVEDAPAFWQSVRETFQTFKTRPRSDEKAPPTHPRGKGRELG